MAARLQILKERLELYLEAERKILQGAQSYTIGNHIVTRANLADIRKVIKDLEDEIDNLESDRAASFSKRVVFMDG